MAQSLNLKIRGLYTNANELSGVPEGALLVADNIDIVSEFLAQPRRGFDRLTNAFSDSSDRSDKLFSYQDKIFAHHGTLGAADTLSYHDAGSWVSLSGAYTAPSSFKMRFCKASQNLYFTTSSGIKKIDAYNATPKASGAFKALDISSSISASAATWLANNYRAAYRAIWGYKDLNNNLILGAPSQRESIVNAAGSQKAVDLRITIPSGVTTAWFVQIYRSGAVDQSGGDIDPNDELGLVYETNPNSTDITNRYIDITDIVPDELRGATIYTAGTQQGLAYQNEQPPMARDMDEFRDCVFYADTTSKHRYTLTMISVGGSAGVQANDTITIGGIAYTAKASETISSAQFAVVTSGSPSQNIRDTALSLVRVINRHTNSTVYAYYLSGPDDLPGKILLEERSIGGNSFAVISSRGTCWNPRLPSSGTTESSSNDRFKNGLYWSKPNEPESVPLVNFAFVGNKDSEILRIRKLRDALLILKEGEGVYRLTGYYPNFTIDLLDSSAIIAAPETAEILNNELFFLATQGVAKVGDSVSVVSIPIEDQFRELLAENAAGIYSDAFAVGYEADRKYQLYLPGVSTDTAPTFSFVFNTFTGQWTKHLRQASCGMTDEGNLYLGSPSSALTFKERKNYNYSDFVDYGFESSITVISDLVLTIGSSVDEIDIGDIIWQSSTLFATAQSIDLDNQTVTVNVDPGFTVAAMTVLKAISTEIKWVPITMGNAGVLKHAHTAELLMRQDFSGTAYVGYESELSSTRDLVPVVGLGIALWGMFPWGEEPWGGELLRRPVRQWITRDKQRHSQLILSFIHSVGYSPWKLQGMTIFGTPGTERVAR